MCQRIGTTVYKYFTSLYVYLFFIHINLITLFTYLLKYLMINTQINISGVKISKLSIYSNSRPQM